MKILTAVLGCVLGAGLLFMAGPAAARSDSPVSPVSLAAPAEVQSPVSTQPGTHAEAQEYERREAESPQVQDFAGGDVVIGVSVGLVVIILIVLIVILLVD